jgi:triosephosphate isomerase
MTRDLDITPPFFEIGPKAYMYGRDLVELAGVAAALGRTYRVDVIVTPQYTDIGPVAREVDGVHVFAQHMDWLPRGRGTGSVLPEAVKAAGAVGVQLNHVERRLAREDLARTVQRAGEVGLATMVCADDTQDAVAVARMSPRVIIVESPGMIAGGLRDERGLRAIPVCNEAIWRVDPTIRVLHGAGISGAGDVYDVIAAGAQGTGSSSAIFTAHDPKAMLEAMIRSVREAWDQTHPGDHR